MNNRFPYFGGPNRPPPVRQMAPIQQPLYGVIQYPGYYYHQPDGQAQEHTQYAQRLQYNTAETIVTDAAANQDQQRNVMYLQGGNAVDNYYNGGGIRQPYMHHYQPLPPAPLPTPVAAVVAPRVPNAGNLQQVNPPAMPPQAAPPVVPAPAPAPPVVPAPAPPAAQQVENPPQVQGTQQNADPHPVQQPPATNRQLQQPPPVQQATAANRQLQDPILFDDMDDFGFSLELQQNLDEVFRLTPDSPEEQKLVDEVNQVEARYATQNVKVLSDDEVLSMPTFMLSKDDMARRKLLQHRIRQKRHIAKLVREKGQE